MDVEVERVNFHEEPLDARAISDLLTMMNIPPRDLLRSNEKIYKELGLKHFAHSDEGLISLMSKHPELIQRPIVAAGDKAVLGRPSERISEFVLGFND